MEQLVQKHIVLIDDDPLFVDFISSILSLEGNFKVESTSNSDELFDLLDKQNFKCVLVDYDLGNVSGLMVGQQIKDRIPSPPPIIMLTGEGTERAATKAFRVGFSDYVSKRHLDKDELIGAIRSSIEKFESDQREFAREERVRQNRRYDELTGLLGVAHTQHRLAELTGPKGGPFALLKVSLAELAELRHTLGYKTADKVLRAFASKISVIGSKYVLCGHLDHDNIAVIISGNPAESMIDDVVEHIRQALTFVAEFDRATVSASPVIARIRDGHEVILSDARSDAAAHANVAPAVAEVSGASAHNGLDATRAKPDAVLEQGAERRVYTRHRVLKRGKIVVNGLFSVVDCTVRDMSDGGARLRVDGFFAAPNRFVLDIIGTDIKRPVSTQWQCGSEIGVRYVEQDA